MQLVPREIIVKLLEVVCCLFVCFFVRLFACLFVVSLNTNGNYHHTHSAGSSRRKEEGNSCMNDVQCREYLSALLVCE